MGEYFIKTIISKSRCKSTEKTILKVVDDKLCCGCGTCVSVCKENAIHLYIDYKKGIYLPKLNLKKCKVCGICYNICPGSEIDFKKINMDTFGKFPQNSLIGNYISCYTGYSNDQNVRHNSSSGGIITQILIDALENGIIDGALVTKMKKNDPLNPEPFIARTKEDIIDASQSKYCPVPANMGLKQILRSENEKFAVVGLPCHIHGIRKAESVYRDLKEKIVLHIGIVCNHTPSFLATEFLLENLKIEKKDVEKIRYRGNGWPGKMTIITKDKKLELEDYWGKGFGQHFFPMRCTLCCDHMAELSDISFADAWLPEIQKKDTNGTSIVIVRKNDNVTSSVLSNNINLNVLDPLKVIESQEGNLIFKKEDLNSRIKLLNLFKIKTPYYTGEILSNPKCFNYPLSIFFYLKLFLYRKKSFWKLGKFKKSFLQKFHNGW